MATTPESASSSGTPAATSAPKTSSRTSERDRDRALAGRLSWSLNILSSALPELTAPASPTKKPGWRLPTPRWRPCRSGRSSSARRRACPACSHCDERRAAVRRDLVAVAGVERRAEVRDRRGRDRAPTTSRIVARKAGSSTRSFELWMTMNSVCGSGCEAGVLRIWSARWASPTFASCWSICFVPTRHADRERRDDEGEPPEDRGLPVARAPAAHAGRDVVRALQG